MLEKDQPRYQSGDMQGFRRFHLCINRPCFVWLNGTICMVFISSWSTQQHIVLSLGPYNYN